MNMICKRMMLTIGAGAMLVSSVHAANTKNVLITGYWPPTNEMIRPFSTNPALNPGGWIGNNWENRGYHIYSYFPTFADPNCSNCGQGTGDFEVDYQDTSADFWPIFAAIDPVAVVTCSRTNGSFVWELEERSLNFNAWVNDYTAPFQPTPSPPDNSVPANFARLSSLPMQSIVNAVNGSGLGLTSYIDQTDSGSFLSGFMAYHGMWYQSLHAAANDPTRCLAAGHIHVGPNIPWSTAHEATKVTLRAVTTQLDSVLAAPGGGDVNVDGVVNIVDLLGVVAAWGVCPAAPIHCPADVDHNGAVNILDLLFVVGHWGS